MTTAQAPKHVVGSHVVLPRPSLLASQEPGQLVNVQYESPHLVLRPWLAELSSSAGAHLLGSAGPAVDPSPQPGLSHKLGILPRPIKK